MQNELLDILVLGLFVVLFGSIYSKRAVGRLRFWVAGWLFVLLSLVTRFVHLASPLGGNLDTTLSLTALVFSGICFLLSSSTIAEDFWFCVLVASFIGVPAVFYIDYVFSGGRHVLPLYAAASAGAAGGTVLAWSVYRRSGGVLAVITLTFVAGEVWTFYAISNHHPNYGVPAVLAEIFLSFAALYWFDFRRYSAGVLTTVIGLLAWAAVFPVSMFCERVFPGLPIPTGLWSAPEYFVAFGMILTLLEDEIFAAGKAGEHYRLLFSASPQPMWIHDPKSLRFLRVNDAAVKHYGYSREEFLELTLHDLRPDEEADTLLRETARSDSFTLRGPWRHRKKDGTEIQVDVAAQGIDFQGRSCRFVLVQDVTEREQLHGQLVHQAHHDTLTGLPNRLLLEDRMQQAFARASRHGHRAAVFCLDLDRFKSINDTLGHAAGDLCLQQVAKHISSRLRSVDTVARTGGEEFIAVLGDLDGTRDAEGVARELLQGIREPIEYEGQVIQISASVGIAVYPEDGTASAELWRAADSAMYEAKRRGGNQYLFASSQANASANDPGELERSMRRALEDGGFDLRYQPVYSKGGDLCSLQALVSLNHPRLGTIAPDRIIPIAEQSGLILPLGDWMLEEVCRQSLEWRFLGFEPVRIAFRVSALQFTGGDFATQVMRALSRFELDPALLELQIAETTVMCNIPEVAPQMRNLASLGVRLSVDAFGSGLSSLSRLHHLSIHSLKIDRSFVEHISTVDGTYSIVQAIVAMGHSLGLGVIADGVDHDDQMEALRILDCDFLQGRLFAEGMPASRISRCLKAPASPPKKRSQPQPQTQPWAISATD